MRINVYRGIKFLGCACYTVFLIQEFEGETSSLASVTYGAAFEKVIMWGTIVILLFVINYM